MEPGNKEMLGPPRAGAILWEAVGKDNGESKEGSMDQAEEPILLHGRPTAALRARGRALGNATFQERAGFSRKGRIRVETSRDMGYTQGSHCMATLKLATGKASAGGVLDCCSPCATGSVTRECCVRHRCAAAPGQAGRCSSGCAARKDTARPGQNLAWPWASSQLAQVGQANVSLCSSPLGTCGAVLVCPSQVLASSESSSCAAAKEQRVSGSNCKMHM